jgi:L-asparaginase II
MSPSAARIQLRNPIAGKKGGRIPRGQYVIARRAALATLPAKAPGMTLGDFRAKMAKRLLRAKGWDPSLSASWYTMAVKLDLEARGEIKRSSGSPQRLVRA